MRREPSHADRKKKKGQRKHPDPNEQGQRLGKHAVDAKLPMGSRSFTIASVSAGKGGGRPFGGIHLGGVVVRVKRVEADRENGHAAPTEGEREIQAAAVAWLLRVFASEREERSPTTLKSPPSQHPTQRHVTTVPRKGTISIYT